MTYAALTHRDPSRVKRWLQERRLAKALALVPAHAQRVVDYGAGDAEVAARLVERRPEVEAICFEPTPALRAEAAVRTAALPGVGLAASESELPSSWADAVFCLEVFEHLPATETRDALVAIERVLRPGGLLIVGVPIEVGPAALAKGAFRRVRRAGEYDADWGRIAGAAMGRPPLNRPVQEIATSRPYHPHHLGFDHRRFERVLQERFVVEARTGSPFGRVLGPLNMELYITARTR